MSFEIPESKPVAGPLNAFVLISETKLADLIRDRERLDFLEKLRGGDGATVRGAIDLLIADAMVRA